MNLFGDVPALLAKLRKDRGWSRGRVADGAGLSEGAILNYENGTNVPGLEAFDALMMVYGIRDLAQLQREINLLHSATAGEVAEPSADDLPLRLYERFISDLKREVLAAGGTIGGAAGKKEPEGSPR